MSLIGILTEHKNESYLKKQLEKMNLDDVFFFSENTIENMHNIKFETLLLGKKLEKNQEFIRDMAQKANYFVINSDIKENLSILENLNLMLITYGYNRKAIITASSIEENNMMICLQRSIKNVYQEEVEPQEIEIKITENINDEAVIELACLDFLYKKRRE